MRITETSTFERTMAVVCDRCKQRFEASTPAFAAITHIDHRCGYGSAWEDGTRITTDICEGCLQALIGDFCRVRITGAARGLLADVEPQTESSDEESRDDALERLRHPVTHYQPPTNTNDQASDWDSYFDSDGPSEDFMIDRSGPVLDPEDVFQSLEQERESGELAQSVTSSKVRYQASTTHSGMLERIEADGNRTTGTFSNGMFKPLV
ncbi:MAG: hypothetical protein V7707_14010 [Motiliproteus sp.]